MSNRIDHTLRDISTRLARVEHNIDVLRALVQQVVEISMALKATDQALISEVHRNTDVAAAATQALTALQAQVADDAKKLADAIANSDAADDADVQAALAELKKNNDAVAAATPTIAAAVANTNPAAPAPTV